jgi:hypothetical protein
MPFALDAGRVIAAGLVATLGITLLLYLVPPVLGLPPLDVEGILGRVFLPAGGPVMIWLGTVLHVSMSTALVVVYGVIMMRLRRQSTASSGLVYGAVLWFLVPMLFLPAVARAYPSALHGAGTAPGPFLLEWGHGLRPAVLALLQYMIFGMVAGGLYKHRVLD